MNDKLWWVALCLFLLILVSCGPDRVYVTHQSECEVSE